MTLQSDARTPQQLITELDQLIRHIGLRNTKISETSTTKRVKQDYAVRADMCFYIAELIHSIKFVETEQSP